MENKPLDLNKLISEHRANPRVIRTDRLTFIGVEGNDVYNISHAFEWKGETYIMGRVEKRHSEFSHSVLFRQVAPYIYQATDFAIGALQDPFVAFVDNQLLIGGTEIYPNSEGHIDSWRTVFFQGHDFDSMKKVIQAPLKMKDVRINAHKGTYYVMSRPQGGVAKWGKIGFASTKDFSKITTEFIEKASLLEDLFNEKVWGGANQIHFLKNGLLGVLGHVAIMSEGDVRHYYGMTFYVDPKTGQRGPMKIIAERSDFAPGATKRP
ncbi:MAG: DUF1861 family protein, partial [Methanomicrobia archaeon]|nr:DUF1861 family protein [Methanomicrobia archaeon]